MQISIKSYMAKIVVWVSLKFNTNYLENGMGKKYNFSICEHNPLALATQIKYKQVYKFIQLGVILFLMNI